MSNDAEPLPAWVYEDKRGAVIGATTFLSVVAVVAVLLRFKCRSMVKAKYGVDDWLILASLPFSIIEAIIVAYTTRVGLGRHVKIVPVALLAQGGKYFFLAQIFWIIATGLVKLSILTFYLRVFGILNYIRFSAWILIILVASWMIGNTVAHGLQCIPVEKIWDSALPGHCLDTVLLYLIGSIADVVFDFIILFLPVPAILRLQLPTSRKLSLLVIFALGGLTCILSLIRFLQAKQAIWDRADLTWISWEPLIWATAEPCLGTLCACLPVLQPLLLLAKEKVTGSPRFSALIPTKNKTSEKSDSSWKARSTHRARGVKLSNSSEASLQGASGTRHWDTEA
ncbi:hypothetical protein GGR51DRAFT_280366 [Nemania sp. FL0031]|nr:hypothetical protein GGR51DRAFT_280366 [Nemania sp. FL0031]